MTRPSMRHRRSGLVAMMIVVVCLVRAHAQQSGSAPASSSPSLGAAEKRISPKISPKPDMAGQDPEVSKLADVSFLQVKMEASRSPIAMDTEAGVSAEIKNVSSVPVLLKERESVFVTMPEMRLYGEGTKETTAGRVETPRIVQGCATFPTQHVSKDMNAGELLLQPNDSYRIFWDLTLNGCTGERLGKVRFGDGWLLWLEQKWQRISFVPGKYTVYLDIVLYPNGSAPSRTATSSTDLQVSASQQMVLLGSFMGGILAYVIKWYYGVPTHLITTLQDGWLKKAFGYTEWFFAGLFGAAMTILASRLSDTFPVKVSANDFWGAVTLGFVFQWIGVKLLEKLPGLGSGPSKPAPAQ